MFFTSTRKDVHSHVRTFPMEITKLYTPSEMTDLGDYENTTYEISTLVCEEDDLQSFYGVVQPVLYSVIFLVGVAGNGLMTTVLLRRRQQLRITEIYLLHLALADLLLLLTLPFDSVNGATGWVFGEFLCMVKGVIRNLNLFCGSLLLALIGFDRYLAIVHAVPSMQSRRPRRVHLMCISLWLISFLFSLPNAVFLSVAKSRNTSNPDCDNYRFGIHAHNWVLAKRSLNNLCFFFSLAVMTYCYTALVITLCNSQKSLAKKGAIRLALLVTLVFCLCWLPYNVASLIQNMVDLDIITYEYCESLSLLNRACAVTESLGISHCCLNPFLYAFVGVQFRNELVRLLCQLGCSRICLPFLRGQALSRPSVSEGTTSNTFFK